jgi:hypothetical protein
MITQLLSALAAALVGGFVVHLLTARRDRMNKARDKQIEHLIEAYRRLEACSNRAYPKDERIAKQEFDARMKTVESAVADVQLLGSARQVELVQRFAQKFAETREASLDELLEDMRSDLRSVLTLAPVPRGIIYFRHTPRD